ncbi:MAG: hypothetical protein PHS30_08810 [Bacteroidales bacterium]|nr:hypothetical protein [Bacteroidales bacterium]
MKRTSCLVFWMAITTTLFWACNDKFTGYEETTAIAGFQRSELVIPDTVAVPTPVIISLSDINYRSDYTMYVELNDRNSFLQNNVLSISNAVFKAADYPNGDSTVIYKVLVVKGTRVAAIMVTPQANELPLIPPHHLTFRILQDTSNLLQPFGSKFYEVNAHRSQITVKIQPTI